MVFEKNGTKFIVPLDPSEGARYTEPVREEYDDEDIENIYNLIVWDEDWINTTVDGRISWEKDSSCVLDSDEELEIW